MPTVRISVDSRTLGEVTTEASSGVGSFDSDVERDYIEETLTRALATIRRAYNIDTKEN
jgi:hypothetical protein